MPFRVWCNFSVYNLPAAITQSLLSIVPALWRWRRSVARQDTAVIICKNEGNNIVRNRNAAGIFVIYPSASVYTGMHSGFISRKLLIKIYSLRHFGKIANRALWKIHPISIRKTMLNFTGFYCWPKITRLCQTLALLKAIQQLSG